MIAARLDSRRQHRLALGDEGPRGRIARVRVGKLLRASPRAEAAYVRELLRIFSAVHRETMAAVEPLLEAPEPRHDADAAGDRARRVLTPALALRVARFVRKRTGEAFDKMAAEVSKRGRAGLVAIGLVKALPKPTRPLGGHVRIGFTAEEAGIQGLLAVARERNIALVDRALRAYADDVARIFTAPATFALRVEDLRDLLYARGKVSLSRAALIGTDQTIKVHSSIARARMLAAGVVTGRWLTSRDERVRHAHVELEGELFSLEDGISEQQAEASGEEVGASPGTPVRCRCTTIPVVEEAALDVPVDVAAE